MNASQTARQRARAELTREIKQEARRQLGAAGAQQLSLRAVARQLGMVSSALYRYYPSRDDLLTALIIDAYDAIGVAAQQAPAPTAPGAPAEQGAAPPRRGRRPPPPPRAPGRGGVRPPPPPAPRPPRRGAAGRRPATRSAPGR